jgi:hypothetical protein
MRSLTRGRAGPRVKLDERKRTEALASGPVDHPTLCRSWRLRAAGGMTGQGYPHSTKGQT